MPGPKPGALPLGDAPIFYKQRCILLKGKRKSQISLPPLTVLYIANDDWNFEKLYFYSCQQDESVFSVWAVPYCRNSG